MASSDGHGTGRRTGGRQGASPAVYRRRRLTVLVLALLVVAALAVGAVVLTGLFARDPDPAAGASPAPVASPTTTTATEPDAVPSPTAATSAPGASPSSSPAPTPATTPTSQPSASGDACATAAVVIRAETDKESYGPDELPVLDLVVRNEGEIPCVVNVGTSQMEFVLTLDDERVFSSTDCQDGSQDLERTLAPDGAERASFEWARNRTVPGCTAVDGDLAGGTYTLVTRLGGRSSSPVTFTLE